MLKKETDTETGFDEILSEIEANPKIVPVDTELSSAAQLVTALPEEETEDEELDLDLNPNPYDGDTPKAKRYKIRQESRVILTNPYQIHLILQWHHQWERFYSNLKYIVIDEAHCFSSWGQDYGDWRDDPRRSNGKEENASENTLAEAYTASA